MKAMIFAVLVFTFNFGIAQNIDQYINTTEATRILSFLASDSLKGRGNMTSEIQKAAIYIANEFKKDSLQYFPPYDSYFQPFLYLEKQEPLQRVMLNEKEMKFSDYVCFSPYFFPPTVTLENFQVKKFNSNISSDIVLDSLQQWQEISSPILIITPGNKNIIKQLNKRFNKIPFSAEIRLIISEEEIQQLTVDFNPELKKRMMFNVLGYLPGKSKPDEIIMITAHYDHVGINLNNEIDQIYNGANDNASGTTAMIMLANYFAAIKNNERSILFVAFAGEELGLIGSNYLASNMNTGNIVALINLEMLGKTRAKEKLSCIVTGEGSLPSFFRKEVKSIKVWRDNNTKENLFKRSDNYPFALQNVPAHTFMIFIPNDEDYHKPSDELQSLDLENMTEIVKGLLPAIEKIVQDKFTPKRLKY